MKLDSDRTHTGSASIAAPDAGEATFHDIDVHSSSGQLQQTAISLLPFQMRLTSSTPCPLDRAVLLLALLLTLLSPSLVLCQTFTFTAITANLPWPAHTNFPSVIAPLSANSLLFFGAANGVRNNDVWLSANSGYDWTIQAGNSTDGSAPGSAADASYPPTAFAMLAYDTVSGLSFHFGGALVDNNGSTDSWYSLTGTKWSESTYTDGSPIPDIRVLGSVVATSNTDRDGSFIMVGGLSVINEQANVTDSALVWKSTAVTGKPDVREWTQVGSTVDASGGGFTAIAGVALVDRDRLDGKDILYMIGGLDFVARVVSDAVWASSDEGATWVQLAEHSFGPRTSLAAAVTDEGVLFVLGGTAGFQAGASLADMWASFDGGYTWSLCSSTLPPRDSATMTYNPYTKQLLYGMGVNRSADDVTVVNDLYSADVSDPSTIAKQCGTTVPSEGVGLTRWPTTADSSSTGAPSTDDSSSSSSSLPAPPTVPITSTPPSSYTSVRPAVSSATAIVPTTNPSSTPVPYPTAASSTYSSSSSSSTGGSVNGTTGSSDSTTSSSSTAVLTTFTVLFAALTVVCSVLAYTQYRLRVYGTVCCEWCAGVTCGQLCGETVGWGTKWTRRSNLSDADLLRQVASDRYD